jgi:hypothetical protein
MISYLLRRSGWKVVYLGSNVPLVNLHATIQSISPSLILSAAQTLNSAASLRVMSEYLSTKSVALAYGGGIFTRIPDAIRCISGHYLGEDVAMVPQIVESLVTYGHPIPTAQPVSQEYDQTLAKFLQNEAAIVTFVALVMQAGPVEPAHVEIGNQHLTRMIASALTLGDLNLLDHSIAWLNGLLKNYGISTSDAKQFFAVYQKAITNYLGDDGAIIRDWLAKNELSL